jgi:hypothetical protein
MDYADFQHCLNEAGISIKELARLLRQNPNSITNYKQVGRVPSHLAVIVVLMRELAVRQIPFEKVIEDLNLRPNAPRGIPIRSQSHLSATKT